MKKSRCYLHFEIDLKNIFGLPSGNNPLKNYQSHKREIFSLNRTPQSKISLLLFEARQFDQFQTVKISIELMIRKPRSLVLRASPRLLIFFHFYIRNRSFCGKDAKNKDYEVAQLF